MALFNWSDKYSVDVPSIDKQHQKLIGMLNELHDAMQAGKGSQSAPAILGRLVDYTQEHFAAEEALMKKARYSDFANHKAEHDKLKDEVVKMLKNFESGKSVLSIELQDYLRNWLQSHILNRDKRYAADMRAAGIC